MILPSFLQEYNAGRILTSFIQKDPEGRILPCFLQEDPKGGILPFFLYDSEVRIHPCCLQDLSTYFNGMDLKNGDLSMNL